MKFLNWFMKIFKPKPSPLAVKVRESREFLGLNPAEAAQLIGVSEKELRKFEAGL